MRICRLVQRRLTKRISTAQAYIVAVSQNKSEAPKTQETLFTPLAMGGSMGNTAGNRSGTVRISPCKPRASSIDVAPAQAEVIKDMLEDTAEEFELCEGPQLEEFFKKLPSGMQALCEPKQDTFGKVVELSGVLELAPGLGDIRSFSIVTGTVKAFDRFQKNELSPLQAALVTGDLLCKALAVAAEHFGCPKTANGARLAAFLCRMTDSTTRLVAPHMEHGPKLRNRRHPPLKQL